METNYRLASAVVLVAAFGLGLLQGCGAQDSDGGATSVRSGGPTATAASGLSGTANVLWFDTYAELRAAPPGGDAGTSVNVAVHRGNAGSTVKASALGAGTFVWTTDTTSADDGATIIVPSGTRTGSWKRIMDNTYNVLWFGAACDGVTDDTASFLLAMQAAYASQASGTILVPAGRTCLLSHQLDLANVTGITENADGGNVDGGAGPVSAQGLTIRGGGMYGSSASTLLLNSGGGACITSGHADSGGAIVTAASVVEPQAAFVTFEDLAMTSTANYPSCFVNARHGKNGDETYLTFRRVRFVGTPIGATTHSTTSAIVLVNAGLVTVEQSTFGGGGTGFLYAIVTPSTTDGTNPNYTSVLRVANSSFVSQSVPVSGSSYAYIDSNPQIYLQNNSGTGPASGVMALHVTGNYFDVGPSGIWISYVQGGDITGNYFRVEDGTIGGPSCNPAGVGVWIGVGAGVGLSIEGNYMDCGAYGIAAPLTGPSYGPAQFYGGSVRDNDIYGLSAKGVWLGGGTATVEQNAFQANATGVAVDIDVATSTAVHVGFNTFSNSGVVENVLLESGSAGYLADYSSASVQDNTTNGAWSKYNGNQLSVPGGLVAGTGAGGFVLNGTGITATNNSANPTITATNQATPSGSQPVAVAGSGYIGLQGTSTIAGGYGLVAYKGFGAWAGYFGGNVDVATGYSYYYNGTICVAGSCSSDERLKNNIEPLKGALSKLLSLRGVTYEWNSGASPRSPPGEQTGFIAQEVERVFPSWVDEHEDGSKGVVLPPMHLAALEVESIRELKAENDDLRARTQRLEERLRALERACAAGAAGR
jgi:hypothetical protein